MALELEKLNIVIEGEAKKATAAIDELIAKLNELKATTEALTNVTSQVRSAFRNIASAAKSASKETIKYASDLGQTTHINADVASSSEAVASSILAISGATNTTRQAFQSTSIVLHDMVNQMNVAYSTAIDLYGGLARSQSAQSGMKQLMGNAWDVYEATFSVKDAVEQTTAALGGFNNTILMLDAPGKIERFGDDMAKSAELTKRTLRSIGNAFGTVLGGVGRATSGIAAGIIGGIGRPIDSIIGKLGNLMRMFQRVALLRLIRWSIRKIIEATKEGLQLLEEWDRTFGNNTSHAAETVDELRAKWRQIEKAIGAAAMPLIQLLLPLVETVQNAVIAVAETFNQLLRSIQGYSTYMKATEATTKKTVGATKELRRVLFGFDELNVLTSSGSTGVAGNVVKIDFVPTDINPALKEVGDNIRNWKKVLFANKDNYLDVNPYLNPQTMEETDTKIKNWLKNLFGIKDEDLKALDEKIMGFFDNEIRDISAKWEEVKQNWASFKTWLAKTFVVPFKEAFADAGDWVISKFPGLAKFLGITQEKVDKIRLEIEAITKPDKETNELESVALKVGTLGINIATKTKLDNDIKKVIGLVGSNIVNAGLNIALGKFASGGSPDMGTLFYAGEQGAEVVANSPSGTGVMNVKQMQDAVSNGNAQVVNTLGAIANVIVRAINEKDTNTYLDGRLITDTVAKQLNNRARATGQAVIVG